MDSKMIMVIGVVVILVAGGAAAAILIANRDNGSSDDDDMFKGVGLKVLGNVNKDNVIDSNDYNEVKKLVDDGKSAEDNKLADANNDGKLDADDLAVIQNIIDRKETKIYHISYHDTDGNGTMDTPLRDTKFPVTSAVMSGSSNSFIMFYMLGIIDEIKGASYGSTNDAFLYDGVYFHYDGKNYVTLDDGNRKVVKLGTSSTTINFENGRIGSSETIAKESVTCVISDWNRTYITNEDAFETAGIDVVRGAMASFEPEVYTHTIALLGLLFDKVENANKLISLYDKTRDDINNALKDLPADAKKKAVASSMDGALSSGDSDYTAVCIAAGAEYGLKGFDFGGSTSVYVNDNLGVFDTRQYSFDNIVHLRTALTYASTTEQVAGYWSTYANAMIKWEHAYDGQVLVSGSIPVPARVAYTAYAIYGSTVPELSESWAKGLVGEFEAMYQKSVASAPNKTLALTSYTYSVTVSDDVIVKNGTTVITSGDEFPYGTKLHIEPKVEKPGFALRADGSSVDADGYFYVINNINARYVDPVVTANLTTLASTFVDSYKGNVYMGSGTANDNGEGTFTIVNTNYKGPTTTNTYTDKFVYFDTASDAKTQYDSWVSAAATKAGTGLSVTKDIMKNDVKVGEVTISYTGKVSTSTSYDYTASTGVGWTAYVGNYVLSYEGKLFYHYSYDQSLKGKTDAQVQEHFEPEVQALANAIAAAMLTVA